MSQAHVAIQITACKNLTGTHLCQGTCDPIGPIVVVQPPNQLDPANVQDNLNLDYVGSVLLPANYDVDMAIEKVIECNCDCWI